MIRLDEIHIKYVKSGEQSPVVEEGLKILGQPPESLVWVTSKDTQPIFIKGELIGRPEISGMYMLHVWTRTK